jgi:hypothetical protein
MLGTPTTYNQESLKDNKLKMRNHVVKGQNIKLGSCTEFTLHVSQQTLLSGKRKNLIDYSQHKLTRYIDTIDDAQQKMVLCALLHDYIKGEVALAWRRGQPVYIQVTKA